MFNNAFIKPVIVLVVVSIPLWFIIRLAFRRRTPGIDTSVMQEAILFCFFIYSVALAAVTIVPLSFALHRSPGANDINIVPLKTTSYAIRHSMSVHQHFRLSMLFENTAGNIVLFIPFGLLLPFILKKTRSFPGMLIAALFCSAGIELIQYAERCFGVYRSVDIDDVILNTTGGIIGWLLFSCTRMFFRIAK